MTMQPPYGAAQVVRLRTPSDPRSCGLHRQRHGDYCPDFLQMARPVAEPRPAGSGGSQATYAVDHWRHAGSRDSVRKTEQNGAVGFYMERALATPQHISRWRQSATTFARGQFVLEAHGANAQPLLRTADQGEIDCSSGLSGTGRMVFRRLQPMLLARSRNHGTIFELELTGGGIKYLTPNQFHYVKAYAICSVREHTYKQARERIPCQRGGPPSNCSQR